MRWLRRRPDEFLLATDIADYLVMKGVPFRESHEVVGRLTAFSLKEGQAFSSIPIGKLKEFSQAFEADIEEVLSLSGGPSCEEGDRSTITHQCDGADSAVAGLVGRRGIKWKPT